MTREEKNNVLMFIKTSIEQYRNNNKDLYEHGYIIAISDFAATLNLNNEFNDIIEQVYND